MDVALLIIAFTFIVYLPLAGLLLYVWWKFGKDEPRVPFARRVFILGSFLIGMLMLFI